MNIELKPISFVTVSHGHYHYLVELLESIKQYWHSPFEFIIVDNLNSDLFEPFIERFNKLLASRVSVVRLFKYDKPKSFGVGNNFAVRHAQYDNLFIINPDTRFIDDSVYQWFQDTDVGSQLYYPKLLNTDGTNQQHYNEWPSIPNQFIRLVKAKLKLPTAQKQKRHDWYFASAIVISKQLFSKLKGFEEIFPLYCEDVDLCYKAYLMGVPFSRIEQVQMVHHLGGEAKHKYLVKAIISNVLWRYVKVRNRILLGNVNRRRNTRYASKH